MENHYLQQDATREYFDGLISPDQSSKCTAEHLLALKISKKLLERQNGGVLLPDTTSQRAAGKRPCRNVTLYDKLMAVKRVHEGETKASVARNIDVPESTLRGWCKNLKRLIQQALDANNKSGASPSANSDKNTSNSLSCSPPSGLNPTSMLESGKEGESIGNILRRPDTEAELVPNSSTAMSTPRQDSEVVRDGQFLAPFYQAILSNPQKTLERMALYKNYPFNYFNYCLGMNPNLFNQSSTSLRNNNSSLTNIMSPNGPTLTKVRKPNTLTLASDYRRLIRNTSSRNHPYKRSKNSSSTESPRSNELSPIPLTSELSNDHAVATSPKPFKSDGEKIDGIVQHLRQQQQQQQGQPPNLHVQVQQDLYAGQSTSANNNRYNILHNQMLSDNSSNDTNDNHDHDNSENSNVQVNESKPRRQLPPGILETIGCGVNYLRWLENHGSAVFTFQEVKSVKMTIDKLIKWAKNTLDQGPKRAN